MGLREEVWHVIQKYQWGSQAKRLKAYALALELVGLAKPKEMSAIDRMKIEPIVIDLLEKAGLIKLTEHGPEILVPMH